MIARAVKAAVTSALREANKEHSRVLKSLEERLATVEAQPRGGLPAGHPDVVRIQKALKTTDDPAQIAQLHRELSFLQAKARILGGR